MYIGLDLYVVANGYSPVQNQTAVAAHFTSKQLLLFFFAQYASTRLQKRILQLKDKQQ